MQSLPDAEFEVMKVVWANEPPITARTVREQLGQAKGWKAQTISTLLLRLVERGFLRTEKKGKLRIYFPRVERDAYLKHETGDFMKRFHGDSFASLVTTLYDGDQLKDSDLDELEKWLREMRE